MREPASALPEQVQRSYLERGLWDERPLGSGLEDWAEREAGRVALVDAEGTWTYGELARRVSAAVRRLRGLGVGPGSVVLLVAPVSAPAVAAYLALLRTGALVVALDRKAGMSDVRHARDQHRISAALAPDGVEIGLDDLGVPVLDLDSVVTDGAPAGSGPEPDPAAPAVALPTSGTTSRPKTVLHSIRTLRAGARNMAVTTAFAEHDAAFLSSPIASITGLMHVHLAIDRGGALVLEERFEPAASLDRVIRHGCTVLGGAPVIAEELLREAARRGLRDLPIRSVALGGAMIPRDLVETAMRDWGIVPSRVYGSSEVPVATHTLPEDRDESRLGDDGAPAEGTEIRISDEGEVLVRGPMLFLGYADPADQVTAFTGDGWFRTGDLGTVHDGRLAVTGRLKEIVIRKGLKVSLPEIDAAARSLPDVEEVAAYAVPDPQTGERLALAVRPSPGRAPTLASVVEALRTDGLATRKLPEELVVWEEPLPRTATGKIQRARLAAGGARRYLADRLLADDAPARPFDSDITVDSGKDRG
ncbi:class I adenylate-forming enzyme family protein [Aeromicrobium choanae]|uniref:Acyl-CoA synthetase (AMP-forming)/AMP-acid ligase II n=1 Tax=Aeromicrobium choanae TaxID=1736691 RepID=A0A1T4YWH4_9ACTN|nr:class I adenylate-forming enzyme family protein [Aeromicrobium choanae]SKB06130.1 Acyl-CoA synthetase (AMP-forming)/AMP-acid ligase II [Aeromicrobium choanae]